MATEAAESFWLELRSRMVPEMEDCALTVRAKSMSMAKPKMVFFMVCDMLSKTPESHSGKAVRKCLLLLPTPALPGSGSEGLISARIY